MGYMTLVLSPLIIVAVLYLYQFKLCIVAIVDSIHVGPLPNKEQMFLVEDQVQPSLHLVS